MKRINYVYVTIFFLLDFFTSRRHEASKKEYKLERYKIET